MCILLPRRHKNTKETLRFLNKKSPKLGDLKHIKLLVFYIIQNS